MLDANQKQDQKYYVNPKGSKQGSKVYCECTTGENHFSELRLSAQELHIHKEIDWVIPKQDFSKHRPIPVDCFGMLDIVDSTDEYE